MFLTHRVIARTLSLARLVTVPRSISLFKVGMLGHTPEPEGRVQKY